MSSFPTLRSALASALALLPATGATSAELDGCASAPVAERFAEFGRTGKMPPELGAWLSNEDAQRIEPWQPFDNVDFVGICWVSAWLIRTDEGVILIDTLYGTYVDQLVQNIQAVGVDLSDIRYVLMTHGHFDHVGGAAQLQPLLPNARFVMTDDGWEEAIKAGANSEGPIDWQMIERDMTVADGDQIVLGDQTVTVLETPGHTWGTASFTYDVRDGDDVYRAVTIGGLGLNAIEGPDQIKAYIASVDRLEDLAEKNGETVKVHLTTHGFSNNLYEKRAKHLSRTDGAPNVFVDPDGLISQLESLRAGAEERLEKESAN